MPKFQVTVEKRLYCSGVVLAEANSPDEAEVKVDALIRAGLLSDTSIEWGHPVKEAGSFTTTGDVD